MIVKYSSLNRLERPKFTLCNPGSIYHNGMLTKIVGMLVDTSDEEIVFNFNATSELNLRVSRVSRENTEDNAYVHSLYKAIKNRRLLFVDDIGFFMITNVEDGTDKGIPYKDVTAKTIDIEIEQKMVPYIEDGTYKFTDTDDGASKGILNLIVETLPLWTIGYVDETVAEKYRTFEDVEVATNCLSFLLEDVQDAYECIIVFDNIHRIINVYAQDNYVRETDIHITKEDLISSLDVTENADDLYTAITVLGDDNVTISAINPLGTNTLYDFSYYFDWMDAGLGEKVRLWQEAVNEQRQPYYELNLEYYRELANASSLEMEIEKYNTQIKMYQRCRDNIVAENGVNENTVASYNQAIVEAGGEEITISSEISSTLAHIDELIAECENAQNSVRLQLKNIQSMCETMLNNIQAVRDSLAFDTYFTQDEYAELCHYVFEGEYTDDYVVITDIMTYDEKFEQMHTLYDRAMSNLVRVSQPTQEFNIDTESFIFCKEFEHFAEQLETGCLINVELEVNDVAQLFLSSLTINYDDHKMSMTFGNRFNKFDTKTLFEDVLGKISKSANTLAYVKEVLYPIKNGEFNAVKDALRTSRNLSASQALSSTNEEVVIDSSGYTGRQLLAGGRYDPRQVKLTGKSMVFTNDSWNSCKVAIGELLFGNGESAYGVNAESIIGDMILGNNIRILDNEGNDLFTVVDGMIKSSVNEVSGNVAKLTEIIQGSDGILIRVQSLENGKEVDSVTTSTGYTFNEDGLTIYKDGEEIKSLLNNKGLYVTRSDEDVLTANNTGVNALNLSARQFLVIGKNSRFEDCGDNRTGCFWMGDD